MEVTMMDKDRVIMALKNYIEMKANTRDEIIEKTAYEKCLKDLGIIE